MHKFSSILILMPAFALAACQSPASAPEGGAANDASAPTNITNVEEPDAPMHQFAAWQGKWTGVEGMFVTITPTDPGTYVLAMQSDLDTMGRYVGKDSDGGISFKRGGETLLLKATTGDETGLKYLAGKTECLMVKSGEGYCRN